MANSSGTKRASDTHIPAVRIAMYNVQPYKDETRNTARVPSRVAYCHCSLQLHTPCQSSASRHGESYIILMCPMVALIYLTVTPQAAYSAPPVSRPLPCSPHRTPSRPHTRRTQVALTCTNTPTTAVPSNMAQQVYGEIRLTLALWADNPIFALGILQDIDVRGAIPVTDEVIELLQSLISRVSALGKDERETLDQAIGVLHRCLELREAFHRDRGERGFLFSSADSSPRRASSHC